MSDFTKGWSRRRFLEAVGKAGGAAAVYETMTALGMLHVPGAFAGPPEIPPDIGKGKRVLILGAGVAGLTAAYELRKGGFDVTILEAQRRPGGRNFTVRRGDVIEQIGKPNQVSRFDDGLYLNAGPGRLPYHHTAVLDYCKALNVPLEVYVMTTRANFFQTDDAFDKKPMVHRRIANDTRGWIADLLAKAINKGSLDKELTGIDKQALLSLLIQFGDVDKTSYVYTGSSRSGYQIEPGVEYPCPADELFPPLRLNDLLSSKFWNFRFYQSEEYEWQPTLFEPVGGMDGVVKGFLPHVGDLILYNREVIGLRNTGDGIEVTHRPAGVAGAPVQLEKADWCISSIPLPILKPIVDAGNFSDDFKAAVAAVHFAPTCKVGWQANRRFWELDSQMYGGISYINHDITQMWYPSYGYFEQKGVLTGAYNYSTAAEELAARDLRDRLDFAAEGAKKLHPGFDQWVPRELGLSIAWQQVPYQLGGWADDWACPDSQYLQLLKPDGRLFVAGDQVSFISGWQEGAIRSALHCVERIVKPELLAVAPAAPERVTTMAAKRRAPAPPKSRRERGLP